MKAVHVFPRRLALSTAGTSAKFEPVAPVEAGHGFDEADGTFLQAIIQTQSELAAAGLDPDTVMRLIVHRTRQLTDADGAVIEMVEGELMVYRAASGSTAPHAGMRLSREGSLSGLCVTRGELLYCHDSEFDPRVDRPACRKIDARSMVVVPLIHDAQVVGVLKVLSSRPSAFAPRHVTALQLLAGVLAASLAHASEHHARQALLAEKTLALAQASQSHAALCESEERFRRSFDDAAIGMALVGLEGQWIKVNRALCEIVGYPAEELLATTFQAITHPDDLEKDLTLVHQLLAGEIRKYQLTKRYFSKQRRIIWVSLSVSLVRNSAGVPLYFVSQIQDITEREGNDRLEEARGEALEMIAGDLPLQPVLARLLSMIEEQLPLGAASFMLLNDGAMHHFPGRLSAEVIKALEDRAVGLAAELCARAEGHEPAMAISHLPSDTAWEFVRDVAGAQGLCCGWSMPIRSNDQAFLAMLTVYGPEHRAPTPMELRAMNTAVKIAVFAIEHFHMTRQLARLAQHDPLTGLPNRMLLEDRLQQALALARRSGKNAAVLAIDVDHFKSVNDTMGHQAGDALLQQFAHRLRSAVRASDTVARAGGDEFTLVLPDVDGDADAVHVARTLSKVLAVPFQVGGRELQITGSIGVAVYPRDGEDSLSLQRAADEGLYRVKQDGRNGFSLSLRERDESAQSA